MGNTRSCTNSGPFFLGFYPPPDVCATIFSHFGTTAEILILKLVCVYFNEVTESSIFPWHKYCFSISRRNEFPNWKTCCKFSWLCGWDISKATDDCKIINNSISFSQLSTVVCSRSFEKKDIFFWKIILKEGNTNNLTLGLVDNTILEIYPKKHLCRDLKDIGIGACPHTGDIFNKGVLFKKYSNRREVREGSVFSFFLDLERRKCFMWHNDIFCGIVFQDFPRIVRPAVSGKDTTIEAIWNPIIPEYMLAHTYKNSTFSLLNKKEELPRFTRDLSRAELEARVRGRSIG